MKYILILVSCINAIAARVSAQNFILHIKNNAHADLTYAIQVQHGQTGMLPGNIPAGQTITLYMNPGLMTGVEGTVSVFLAGQQPEKTDIHYNNPLIGTASYQVWSSAILHSKPLKWEVLKNKGGDGELSVEITNPGSMYGKPVPVTYNKNAVIQGSVFWKLNDILSPEVNPYGNAFSASLVAPSQFIESNGPFTLEKTGTYNGKSGFFQGRVEVGAITFEMAPSFNPGYAELHYSITGVPSGIPLELDLITDLTKSGWVAGPGQPKPGEDYVFIVGTFPSAFKTQVTIDPGLLQIRGVDFICEGEWVKPDAGGSIPGGGNLVNKIAARKTNPVLPGNGMIAVNKTEIQQVQQMQVPGQQNKTQTMQVQKVKTSGAVRIRQ